MASPPRTSQARQATAFMQLDRWLTVSVLTRIKPVSVGFPPYSGYFRHQTPKVQSAIHSVGPMPAERILVVDDEDPIREVVSSMLTSANYICSQASSGKEALAMLDSGENFELMLSDLMMAGMDGIALLEATKERFPDMPVVMVTAVHDVSVALNAIRNGAYDYLLKPFEREQLLATVRRALENRKLKLENRAYQTSLEALVTARTEQLRQTLRELEESYDITLAALGDALDLKDRETEGHSKRVTAFTIEIGRAHV